MDCSAISLPRPSYGHSQSQAVFPDFKGLIRLNCRLHIFPVRRQFLQNSPLKFSQKIVAEGNRQPWDIGRFLQTLYFFNGPPSPVKLIQSLIEQLSGSSSRQSPTEKEKMDTVLVAGATGGVGKRVVDILRKKGIPVRALVRNVDKARSLLGPDVDLVIGDITQQDSLIPEYFQGVKRVINAVSVIVGPKEGDTPDRAKYNQGIKFFEPEVDIVSLPSVNRLYLEAKRLVVGRNIGGNHISHLYQVLIKGASPELVEYVGMKNLINAVRENVGLRDGKILFGFQGNMPIGPTWGALDDVVMGGVSQSSIQISIAGGEDGSATGCFKGFVSTANNGGFSSIRTKNFSPLEDLSAYDGLELRLKGDGHRYKLIIRTSTEWDAVGYTISFDTIKEQWQTVRLPFSSFKPVFRARTVTDAAPFDSGRVASLQLMYSKFEYDGKLNPSFEPGSFELPISSIKAYLKEPITARFVHVGSAGVTRPERPGLDLSKQPPAVRLNKELGYILTFKLKGEDLLRDSGIPYTIIRPCALTEEPAGADLIFEQGDNITGKISREEVALICVAALESSSACDTTFEVKSVVPFSEPFKIDPNNPPAEKDYDIFFQSLKKGITGKEALEKSPVAV